MEIEKKLENDKVDKALRMMDDDGMEPSFTSSHT